MFFRHVLGFCAVVLLTVASLNAASSDIADAVMKGYKEAVRSLLARKVDMNAPQIDGTTALHWSVLADDVETIGVGNFRPNNAIVFNEDGVKLTSRVMQEKGIQHTTSECTSRGFTCSTTNVDPKTATPAQNALIRKIQIGHQVDGLTGGLGTKDQEKK